MIMHVARRRLFRAGKCLAAGFLVYFVSWIASVTEWSPGEDAAAPRDAPPMSTMRTIVAYSEGKQAEMDRPAPVTCDDLPSFPKVPYFNHTWVREEQHGTSDGWQTVPGTDVSLYAAYYDARLPTQPYVRILARFRGRRWGDRPQLYCQTRASSAADTSVEVVAARALEIWRSEWDPRSQRVDTPLLLSCSLRGRLAAGAAALVSVVPQPCCDPANAFLLRPLAAAADPPPAYLRNFTVCVKDLRFPGDKAQSVLEWIEVNRILGAQMIDIYVDRIGEALRDVLEHYRREGIVRLFKVPVRGDGRSLWQRRRDHIVTYNDCLYRNIDESKFILPIDVDEVVLPKVAVNWEDLISRFEALDWDPSIHSAIMVKNVFFFDFMQEDGDNFQNRNVNSSKLYIKRDNVRLAESIKDEDSSADSHRVSESEVSEYSVKKTVIADKGEEAMVQYAASYRRRCGRDGRMPTVVRHRVRSAAVSPAGRYSKSLMLTRRVLTAFNHYPLDSLGTAVFGGWPAPFREVQMNHYKAECNTSLVAECAEYVRARRCDRAALRLRTPLLRALAAAPCPPAPASTAASAAASTADTHSRLIKL